MPDLNDDPNARLLRAIAKSGLFSGFAPVAGSAIPGIAMPMHLGLDALSCLIAEAGTGKTAFAKSYRTGALAPFSVSGAIEAAQKAGEAGIGPEVLGADEAESVVFFRVAGATQKMTVARQAQQRDVKAAIAATKKRWHQQALLSTNGSPFDLARDYCARLEPHLAPGAPRPLPFKGGVPFVALKDWLDHIEAALKASGTDRMPIHGENTVSNILLDESGGVCLVDFDRAVNGDPMSDLGALMLDLCRDDTERMELIEMYSGRADGRLLARAKLYALVDDFLWGCWALLAERNPAMQGPEFFKYGSNRFVRMSFNVQAYDTPSLLLNI